METCMNEDVCKGKRSGWQQLEKALMPDTQQNPE